MLPPFLSAALAPTALAGLLALVPGTSQAAPAAASSPAATPQQPVLTAATVSLSNAAARAVPRTNHIQAGTSHAGVSLGHTAGAAKPESKQVTLGKP
jgi:hypothetical protein